MRIYRSAKCSLKFTNKSKLDTLKMICKEYTHVVNRYIDLWWDCGAPAKMELRKEKINLVSDSWLLQRMRRVAAREAIDMIKSSRRRSMVTGKAPIKQSASEIKPEKPGKPRPAKNARAVTPA